jgi:hypothetical protein
MKQTSRVVTDSVIAKINAGRTPAGHFVGIKRHTTRQLAILKQAFLEKIAQTGNIGYSCDLVGVNRSTYYSWMERDEQFALAFRQAEVRATEVLESEAWRRAVEGSPYSRTSYYRGEPVGTDHKIEYSDQLMLALLRARAPEKYREKMDLNVSQVVKTIAGVEASSVL